MRQHGCASLNLDAVAHHRWQWYRCASRLRTHAKESQTACAKHTRDRLAAAGVACARVRHSHLARSTAARQGRGPRPPSSSSEGGCRRAARDTHPHRCLRRHRARGHAGTRVRYISYVNLWIRSSDEHTCTSKGSNTRCSCANASAHVKANASTHLLDLGGIHRRARRRVSQEYDSQGDAAGAEG